MSHEVENMFSVAKTPWHGLGTILENPPTIDEAIKCAGLDWEVECRPLTTPDGQTVSHRALTRSSDGQVLGVVGPSYCPLQNRDAFQFFQPWLDGGEATLETAGSLRDGQRVWILAKIGDPIDIVKGDPILPFALLSNSHDGKRAARLGFTPVRVVCANTEAAALRHSDSKLVRVLHNGRVLQNLEDLRELADVARGTFTETAEQYRQLAGRKCNADDLLAYVRGVFGSVKQADDQLELVGGDMVAKKIIPLFESGNGNALKGVRGTMWAAYNAVTEYLSHERGTSNTTADMRLDSSWFGSSASVNKKALSVALRMSA